jgi:hypothetical protein
VPSADELGASHYVLRQGIIGPLRRLNNTAHNDPQHTIARSSDQPIKLLSFHSGDSLVFLDLPLARIVDQSVAYQSVSRPRAVAYKVADLPNPPLVLLDTLAGVRPSRSGTDTLYEGDYKALRDKRRVTAIRKWTLLGDAAEAIKRSIGKTGLTNLVRRYAVQAVT